MKKVYVNPGKMEKESIALFKKNLLKESYLWFQCTDYNERLRRGSKRDSANNRYETENTVTGRIQFGWRGIFFLLGCVIVICDNASWQSCNHSVDNIFYSPEALTIVYSVMFILYAIPLFIFHQCLGLISQSHCIRSCKMVSTSVGFLGVLSLFSSITFSSIKICAFALECIQIVALLFSRDGKNAYKVIRVFIDLNTSGEECESFSGYKFIKSLKHCVFFDYKYHTNFYENIWFIGNKRNFWYLVVISALLLLLFYFIIRKGIFRVFKFFIFVIMINWITSKTVALMNYTFILPHRRVHLVKEIQQIIREIGIVKLIMFLYGTVSRSCSVFIFSTFASYFHTDMNTVKICLYLLVFYVLNMYFYLKNEEFEYFLYNRHVLPTNQKYNFIKCNTYSNLFFEAVEQRDKTKLSVPLEETNVWQKLCIFFSSYTYMFTAFFTVLTQLIGPVNILNEMNYSKDVNASRSVHTYKSLLKLYEKMNMKKNGSKISVNHNSKQNVSRIRMKSERNIFSKWFRKKRKLTKTKFSDQTSIHTHASGKNTFFPSREKLFLSDSDILIPMDSSMNKSEFFGSDTTRNRYSVSFKSYASSAQSKSTKTKGEFDLSFNSDIKNNKRRMLMKHKRGMVHPPYKEFADAELDENTQSQEDGDDENAVEDSRNRGESASYGSDTVKRKALKRYVKKENNREQRGQGGKGQKGQGTHFQSEYNTGHNAGSLYNPETNTNMLDELIIKKRGETRQLSPVEYDSRRIWNAAATDRDDRGENDKNGILKSHSTISKKTDPPPRESKKNNSFDDHTLNSLGKKETSFKEDDYYSYSDSTTMDNFSESISNAFEPNRHTQDSYIHMDNYKLSATQSTKHMNNSLSAKSSSTQHKIYNFYQNSKWKRPIITKYGTYILFFVVYVFAILHIVDFERNYDIVSEVILHSLYRVVLIFIITVQVTHACWFFGIRTQMSQCGSISCALHFLIWVVLLPVSYLIGIFNYARIIFLVLILCNIVTILISYLEVALRVKRWKENMIRYGSKKNISINDENYLVEVNKWKRFKKCVFWLYIGNIDILRKNINLAVSGEEDKYIPIVWCFLFKYVNSSILTTVTLRFIKEYIWDVQNMYTFTFSVVIELLSLILVIAISIFMLGSYLFSNYSSSQNIIIPHASMGNNDRNTFIFKN